MTKTMLLVLRGVEEENRKISLLVLEESGLLEVSGVSNSLCEVVLIRGDSS